VPGQPEPLQGPKGYLMIIAMMRSGFPDIQWTIEDMITENDKVAVRFTMRGTHQGTFFGVPATDKTIVVQAMNFYRLADDQIIEEFGQPDMLGLLNPNWSSSNYVKLVPLTDGLRKWVSKVGTAVCYCY
jgi:steroid delta-isomerase-like uncharacterized protein